MSCKTGFNKLRILTILLFFYLINLNAQNKNKNWILIKHGTFLLSAPAKTQFINRQKIELKKGWLIIRGTGQLWVNNKKYDITNGIAFVKAIKTDNKLDTIKLGLKEIQNNVSQKKQLSNLQKQVQKLLIQEQGALIKNRLFLSSTVNIKSLEKQMTRDVQTFASTGTVSIEAGAACLDAAGGSGQISGNINNGNVVVEKGKSILKIKVKWQKK